MKGRLVIAYVREWKYVQDERKKKKKEDSSMNQKREENAAFVCETCVDIKRET